MALPDIFNKEVSDEMIRRIHLLTPETRPNWGKMTVDQMLAHLCVSYEMVYENKHKRPGAFARFLLKLFVKNAVVSEKPYKKSLRTAPAFLIADKRNFETERDRLIGYITKTQELGPAFFKGKKSLSFDELTVTEWNNLFSKHLNHHLSQFGV